MNPIAQHLIPYRAYLTEQQRRLTQEIAKLEQQNRQDEANLQKVRLNIVQVFETVASADEKQSETWEDFLARYTPRFDTLTAPWCARLSAAVLHSDSRTRMVEETKLSMANHIQNAFNAIRSEEP